MTNSADYTQERLVAEDLARQAGVILLHYRRHGFEVELKTSQDDPVTVADREASELIVAGLRAAFPHDGILSEELLDTDERLDRERVWIIDPIDGTKEYVDGKPDYCVSIGLSVRGEAVLGVVLAPENDELFTGIVGQGVQVDQGRVLVKEPGRFFELGFQRLCHRLQITGFELESHQRQISALDVIDRKGGGNGRHGPVARKDKS